MKDAALKVTKAFPAAGASNSTDGIDLKARGTPNGEFPAHAEVWVTIPDVAGLADTKSLTVTFKDSDDNSTFASANRSLPVYTLTGAGGAGATGITRKFRLPPDVKRYICATSAVEASGGTLTSQSLTVELYLP